ncbi:AAA family ATPase [Streptomyces iconiensis]|uniref:AAA family ATPase n=1 Tax=Streptomyces iconiensis TaxID=1384038 RepID=A0ABT7A774_9ACTN|nr:ATP-binding protein [Streptomyces iconiensis]MDJ1137195.1 AAA family ATPase [Streptomyces iconiensis]
MLLRFRVANHRSIRDECTLSLISDADEADDSRTPRQAKLRRTWPNIQVLPVLGVFGANASGKSNLLSALYEMREAVRVSFSEWNTRPGIPRQPFKLDPACAEETTLFEVDLVLGTNPVRYTYGFELSDERVEAEWLHAYPDGVQVVWFDREADRPEDEGGEFLFPGEGFQGKRDVLVDVTRPDSLFLSTGAALNDPQLSAIHRWFLNNLWLVTPGADVAARTTWTQRLLSGPQRNEAQHAWLTELLGIADLGLTGVDVDEETGELTLRHRTPDGGEAPLEFLGEESLGTHAWFAFIGPMLQVLDAGTTLMVDELDSSLHPTLAAEVVRLFQDPKSNPRDAQLLFTTHDATLLGKAVLGRPLEREQVWIAAKRSTGESEFYPLEAAHPRQDEDLEQEYLRGRYGGAPRVSAGEIARALAWREKEREHEREAKASA